MLCIFLNQRIDILTRSMTGFGLASGPASGGVVQVEVRTVNHRHFTLSSKLASPFQPLEAEIRKRLHERVHRGHLTLVAKWIEEPERPAGVRVNIERAKEVVDALNELKFAAELPGEIDLSFVARQPEVFTVAAGSEVQLEENAFYEVLDGALTALVETREREGASLTAELETQLDGLTQAVMLVESRAPDRIVMERDRLRKAVEELLDTRPVDDERLSHELAILADKLDVTEEIVRLRTHIAACGEVLKKVGPVGRELTFLGQEMLREINTIGSKANDAQIAQAVIDMKCLLEKFREQVENIE